MAVSHDFKVFSGNSNRVLTEGISKYLDRPISKAEVGRFSDGEIQVEIGENVRGFDVFGAVHLPARQ
jgi:ribose-phosphate pyrophosphokinase